MLPFLCVYVSAYMYVHAFFVSLSFVIVFIISSKARNFNTQFEVVSKSIC